MLKAWESVRRCDKQGIAWLIGAAAAIALLFVVITTHRARIAIDPLVGAEKWATGVQRQTNLGTYRVWESADFKGGDLSFKESKSIDECLYFCDETPECIYVALWNGFCYLKDAPTRFDVFKSRPGLLSAKKVLVKPIVSKDLHESESKITALSTYRVWADNSYDGEDGRESIQTSFDSCLRFCDDDAECIHVTFDGRRCRAHKETSRKLKRTKTPGSTAAMKSRMHNAPDPLIRHHWTKGGEHQTEFAVYQTWQECQFKGADIVAVKAKTLHECLQECDAELFCHHVTLVGQECMLKGWSPEYFEIVTGRKDVWAAKQIAKKPKDAKYTVFQSGVSMDNLDLGDLRHDLLVGEHFDESTPHETKFNRYRLWVGFDFIGGDINKESLNLPAYTVDTCLEQCDLNSDCAYAVVILGKDCWLKTRPYQHTRMVDFRGDVIAAMKLGRVGKRGADAATMQRYDRRPSLAYQYSDFGSYGPESASDWSLSKLFWFLCLGGGFVAVAGYGVSWWSRRSLSYANELA